MTVTLPLPSMTALESSELVQFTRLLEALAGSTVAVNVPESVIVSAPETVTDVTATAVSVPKFMVSKESPVIIAIPLNLHLRVFGFGINFRDNARNQGKKVTAESRHIEAVRIKFQSDAVGVVNEIKAVFGYGNHSVAPAASAGIQFPDFSENLVHFYRHLHVPRLVDWKIGKCCPVAPCAVSPFNDRFRACFCDAVNRPQIPVVKTDIGDVSSLRDTVGLKFPSVEIDACRLESVLVNLHDFSPEF